MRQRGEGGEAVTRYDSSNHEGSMSRRAGTPRALSELGHGDASARAAVSLAPPGPLPPDSAHALYVMAQRIAYLCALGDLEAIKAGITHNACSLVPGCEHAALLPPGARRRWNDAVWSSEVAAACCAAEKLLAEGPASAVIAEHRPARLDPEAHPQFARAVTDSGVLGALAVPLIGRHGEAGALCLYAGTADAFDERSELIARAYALHAAVALNAADAETNLRTALRNRDVIARAVGILMQRHRILPEAAFEMLRQTSQRAHLKLRDVAAWVHDTGADPRSIGAAPD